MALDAAILEEVIRRRSLPTVRVYSWDMTAVSVGRYQHARFTLKADTLLRHTVPVVRRPTGGRGVLHGGDLTVSIVAPQALVSASGSSVPASHQAIMAAVVSGLSRVGARASIGSGMHHPEGGDCFASSCSADALGSDGAKLAGGAQRRHRDCLLEQVSIRWRPTSLEPDQVFVGGVNPTTYPLSGIDEAKLTRAVIAGLEDTLKAELVGGTLSEIEVRETELRMPEHIVDLSTLM